METFKQPVSAKSDIFAFSRWGQGTSWHYFSGDHVKYALDVLALNFAGKTFWQPNSLFVKYYLPIKEQFIKKRHIVSNPYLLEKWEKNSAVLTVCLNLTVFLLLLRTWNVQFRSSCSQVNASVVSRVQLEWSGTEELNHISHWRRISTDHEMYCYSPVTCCPWLLVE